MITYWAGRFDESVRYAELGAEAAEHSRGTAAVWLASGEARSLAATGRHDEARAALCRAADARDRVKPDELDQIGGLCTFNRSRQLYYAADALVWGGQAQADHTERTATETLDSYAAAPAGDRAFGDESGARCDLAIARVLQGELEGATEAMAPVLDLPADRHIHGVVVSVDNARTALRGVESPDRMARELHDAIESFTAECLALPS